MEYAVYTWLGLLIVLLAIEGATVSLTSIWFAAGSLVAFVFALFGAPLWTQITVFLITSIVLVIFTRPVAVKYLKVGKNKTNLDLIIGQKAIVVMDITEFTTGQVKVKGQIWSAVCRERDFVPKDTEVTIKAIEGVKLIVSPEAVPDNQ